MSKSRLMFYRPIGLALEMMYLARGLGVVAVLLFAYGANSAHAESAEPLVIASASVPAAPVAAAPRLARGLAPVRDISLGEIITADLLTPATAEFPGPDGADMDLLVGKEARRALISGQIIRSSDVRAPRAIRKGENVTLVWQAAGVTITAQGTAMSDADLNGRARVNNPRANKVIEGTAIGRGRVRVNAPNM